MGLFNSTAKIEAIERIIDKVLPHLTALTQKPPEPCAHEKVLDRLLEFIDKQDGRNKELHEKLVALHGFGLTALENERANALALAEIEADAARVSAGLKPIHHEAMDKTEEPVRPHHVREVPGGDGDPDVEGAGAPV